MKAGASILILLLATACIGQLNVSNPAFVAAILKPAAGGVSCTTARDTWADTTSGTFPFGASSARQLAATGPFTAAASATICRIDIPLYKVGSPTFTMTAVIYTDSGGTQPGTQVGTASGTVDASTLGTSEPGTWVSFTGASCAITSGTAYWVVVTTSAQDGEVDWPYGGGFGTGIEMTFNGTVWSTEASRRGKFALFSN